MAKRLLVVPNDKIEDYDMKGFSREDRNKYFNPNGEFEVSILGYKDSMEKSHFAGFPVFPIGEDESKIDEVLEKVNPDLVRGYNGDWGARVSGEIGKKMDIPSFTSVHNLMPTREINNVDKIFCVSDAVRQKCLGKGASTEKLYVLHDYVDLDNFKDKKNSYESDFISSIYHGKNRSLSVGRFVWQKNLENLLEGLSNVRQNEDFTHIHIGEKGDLENHIKSTSGSLSLDNVYFLPNQSQENLSYFHSWADIFSMFSVSEGFGLVYAEALATGTPVVTSNLEPMTEYVKHGYNGFLADPHSPDSISENIIRAFNHPELSGDLSNNARDSSKVFDREYLKKEEAKLYKEMLK